MIEDDTVSKDDKLDQRLSELKKTYNKRGKDSLVQYLSIVKGSLDMETVSLEDDFNREVKFYAVALENAKEMIEKLTKKGIPVWRPNDFKAETFKTDYHMQKVQKHLQEIQQKLESVEKRKDAKNKKKFSNEAHKRHVKAKQSRLKENKAKKVRKGKDKSARYMRNKKRN